jgi:serine/threonine protein phosphatase PrpC
LGYIGYNEMATTASIVKIMKDGTAVIGNVGDSRVYVHTKYRRIKHITTDDGPFESKLENGNKLWDEYLKFSKFKDVKVDKIEQKLIQEKVSNMDENEIKKIKDKNTLDCSIEEIKIKFAIFHGNKISQSLGSDTVNPNIVNFKAYPGDRVIITSDGVHDVLSSQEIIDCVSECRTAEEAARALVRKAREKGLDKTSPRCKDDDTTAVVMICSGEGGNNAETSDGATGRLQTDIPSTSQGGGRSDHQRPPSEIEEEGENQG